MLKDDNFDKQNKKLHKIAGNMLFTCMLCGNNIKAKKWKNHVTEAHGDSYWVRMLELKYAQV